MKRESNIKSNSKLLGSINAVFWGTVVGILFSAIMLLLFAFAFVKVQRIPEVFVGPITLCTLALAAFLSGYITVRKLRINGMFYGMVSGFSLFIITFIAGLIGARDSVTMITVVKCLLMLLTGAIGGIVGVNKKSR